MVKLPNGFVLATLMPAFSESEKVEMNEFNQKSIAIFNNKEAKFYETINYESFDIGKAKDMELSANDLIKCAYADGYTALSALQKITTWSSPSLSASIRNRFCSS